MTVMTQAKLDVVPLTKHIGAEIRGLDLREKPDDATIKAIYQAWLDHIVIIFPDQKLSQEDLIRVTGYFGEQGMPRRPPKFFPKGYASILPGIMLISNIRENGEPIGALPDGEMMFHHDMIHAEVPSKATLLYSVEVPSAGGNTLFSSGYAAYDTLDPAVRAKLEGRIAITIKGTLVGVAGPGGVFGEMALVDQSTRAATAVAETECKLLAINRNAFLHLVKTSPAFGASLLSGLAERAKEMAGRNK